MNLLKTFQSLLAAGALVLAAPFALAQTGERRADVNFVNPENFTDLRDSYFGSESARKAYMAELRQHIQRRAAAALPAGHTLHVSITNVDMAGDFEPTRGPAFSDVRLVRAIYPPSVELSYRVTNASGDVVAQGQERLTNLAFQTTTLSINQDQPLFYVKNLLSEWISDLDLS